MEKSNSEKIHIDLEDKATNKDKFFDITSDVINVLEENLDQVVIRSCGISEEAQTEMLPATLSTPEIVANRVAIYKKDEKGICVVGFKDDVIKTYDLVKELTRTDCPCTRQLKINPFESDLLTKLDFIGYVRKECNIKIDISSDKKSPIILIENVTANGVHQTAEKIDQFRNSLVWTEYNVAPAKVALLRHHEAMKSIEKIFENENLLCYVDICDGSESVFIYTRTEEDGKTAAMIIKTSIQKITIKNSFAMSKKFSLILERFQGKILVRRSDKSDSCRICCFNDALAEISVALINLEKKPNAWSEKTESDKQLIQIQKIFDTETKSKINPPVKKNASSESVPLSKKEYQKREVKRDDSLGTVFVDVTIPQVSRREFEIFMFFWGNDYMKAHQDVKISYGGDQRVFVQCDQTEKENLKKIINNEICKIRKMTGTEIKLEKSQIKKAISSLQTLKTIFREVFFFINEDNCILHAVGDNSYTQNPEILHIAKLLTGQIKETKNVYRFAASEDVTVGQNDRRSEQNVNRSMPDSILSHDSKRSSSKGQNRNTDGKKNFTTKEGIDIYVYSGSILQLDVDCIVNSANERLGHGAGVSAVIARAAGYKLEEEGKEYIERYGPIPVGECCHTTAGRLPYKYVIHTVGPRWSNSMTLKEQEQCKKELQSAIESCFYEADILRMKSIGVPSVSAGIFGMPPYICAKQYLEAVLNYSRQRTRSSKSTTLQEMHFIDMNIEMCKQIADVFSKSTDLVKE